MHAIMNDPVFSLYALCATVLALKILILGATTGITRVLRGNFISPEDYAAFRAEASGGEDAFIERLRRAHQNDLENIGPFFVIGAVYALSGASYGVAWWLFTMFTTFRVLHTLAYAAGLQPWRTIVFEIANIANVTMAILALMALLG